MPEKASTKMATHRDNSAQRFLGQSRARRLANLIGNSYRSPVVVAEDRDRHFTNDIKIRNQPLAGDAKRRRRDFAGDATIRKLNVTQKSEATLTGDTRHKRRKLDFRGDAKDRKRRCTGDAF